MRKDFSSSLLGWEEEDYTKVNKKLTNYGKRYKDNFFKRKNQLKEVSDIYNLLVIFF
jgi:hypothetical protein